VCLGGQPAADQRFAVGRRVEIGQPAIVDHVRGRQIGEYTINP
jgi:hypothetical protein